MTADTDARTATPHFGDAQTEYTAARESAVVFDLSDRTQLEMTGADRHSFLHNFTTNNINGLLDGRACEALLCNVKGRILGHVFIFAGEETTWVESVPGQSEFLTSHLERYHLLEDFTLTNCSAERGELLVTGPKSADALGTAGIEAADMPPMTCRRLADTSLDLRRIDLFGDPAFLIAGPGDVIETLWAQLTDAGLQPAGRDAFETLRIEAAFPTCGIDLSDENLGQEACRTQQAISFEKGCYLGQEPIARIHAMGHVNRELRRFIVESDDVPPPGTALLNPSDQSKEIGRLTSVAWSWQFNRPVGLGMVRTKWTKPDSEVLLATDPVVTARVFPDA